MGRSVPDSFRPTLCHIISRNRVESSSIPKDKRATAKKFMVAEELDRNGLDPSRGGSEELEYFLQDGVGAQKGVLADGGNVHGTVDVSF